MIKYLALACVLTACTVSVNQIQNEGESDDMIDSTQSTEPSVSTSIPFNMV